MPFGLLTELATKQSMWAVLSTRILSFAVAAAASHRLPSSTAEVFSSHRGLSGVCTQNEPDDTSVALCQDWCSEPAHCASRTLHTRSLSAADLLWHCRFSLQVSGLQPLPALHANGH